MKSQRTYEVRTRAAVILAIKAAAAKTGIDIPKDTTISFADAPLIVEQHEAEKPGKMRKTDKPAPKQTALSKAEAELAKPADARLDPEAEVPQQGELNEGVDVVPR